MTPVRSVAGDVHACLMSWMIFRYDPGLFVMVPPISPVVVDGVVVFGVVAGCKGISSRRDDTPHTTTTPPDNHVRGCIHMLAGVTRLIKSILPP